MKTQISGLMQNTNLLHFEGERGRIAEILEGVPEVCGFADDSDSLYAKHKTGKYLEFFAALAGNKKLLGSVIEQMHLGGILDQKLEKCTKGEKRRAAIARELLKDADVYVLADPLSEIDDDSRRIILNWMESFHENGKRLVTLSQSRRYTCLCPGSHYEITEDGIVCIDREEATEENPDVPVISKIPVTYDEKIFLFNPEEIDYIEANDGQVYIYVNREQYLGAFKMGELEERLARFGFFRCHRSYIVNVQKVAELVKWTRNSYSLRLARYEKTDIPLSKGKIQEWKSLYEF